MSSDRRPSSTAPSLSSQQGHRQRCPSASLLHQGRRSSSGGRAGAGLPAPRGMPPGFFLLVIAGCPDPRHRGQPDNTTLFFFMSMYAERCLGNLEGAAFAGAWGHCRRWLWPHQTKRRKTSWVPTQGSKQFCCQKPGIRELALGNFVSVCVFSQIFL